MIPREEKSRTMLHDRELDYLSNYINHTKIFQLRVEITHRLAALTTGLARTRVHCQRQW